MSVLHNGVLSCLRPLSSNRKRSASTESHDSISDELYYFKPISTAPKTPPKKLPNGQILESQVIRTKPRKLLCHFNTFIDPPFFSCPPEVSHFASYSSPVVTAIADQHYDISDFSLPAKINTPVKFIEETAYEESIDMSNVPTSSNSEFYSQIKDTLSNIDISCNSVNTVPIIPETSSNIIFEDVDQKDQNVNDKTEVKPILKKTHKEHKRKKTKVVKETVSSPCALNLTKSSKLDEQLSSKATIDSTCSVSKEGENEPLQPTRKSRLRRRAGPSLLSQTSSEVRKQMELDYTLALHLQKIYNQEMRSRTTPMKSCYLLRSRSQQCLM